MAQSARQKSQGQELSWTNTWCHYDFIWFLRIFFFCRRVHWWQFEKSNEHTQRKGFLTLPPPSTSIFTFLPSPQFSTDLTSFKDNSDLSIAFFMISYTIIKSYTLLPVCWWNFLFISLRARCHYIFRLYQL